MALVKRKVANGNDKPTPRKKKRSKDRTSKRTVLQVVIVWLFGNWCDMPQYIVVSMIPSFPGGRL
jgi:hypothetical protein